MALKLLETDAKCDGCNPTRTQTLHEVRRLLGLPQHLEIYAREQSALRAVRHTLETKLRLIVQPSQ